LAKEIVNGVDKPVPLRSLSGSHWILREKNADFNAQSLSDSCYFYVRDRPSASFDSINCGTVQGDGQGGHAASQVFLGDLWLGYASNFTNTHAHEVALSVSCLVSAASFSFFRLIALNKHNLDLQC
jgi:hypothetical protein